jgi:putative addiction module component (TIGR02574 family)
MGQPLTVPPPGFDELPVEEQIEYVQSLWNRILRLDQADVRSPDWHRDEVRKALAEHDANRSAARPWTEVRAELESKLRSR